MVKKRIGLKLYFIKMSTFTTYMLWELLQCCFVCLPFSSRFVCFANENANDVIPLRVNDVIPLRVPASGDQKEEKVNT